SRFVRIGRGELRGKVSIEGITEGAELVPSRASGWLDVEAPKQTGELLLRERLAGLAELRPVSGRVLGQRLHHLGAGQAEGSSRLVCRLLLEKKKNTESRSIA